MAKRTPLDAVRPLPIFVECLPLPSACLALGKDSLCRVQVFAECQAFGKGLFAECHILSSAALGKAGLCRVPEIWHSAKIFALGKSRVSRSVGITCARSASSWSTRTGSVAAQDALLAAARSWPVGEEEKLPNCQLERRKYDCCYGGLRSSRFHLAARNISLSQ